MLEKQTEGKFAPGTSWTYSNSGYVVLGLIVARTSGMPYRDFLQKRIFSPAGMEHSVVYQKGKDEISQRANGNSKDGGKLVETDQSSTSATLGDGGVYSNLSDMAKWDEALQKHTLLSADPRWRPLLRPQNWPTVPKHIGLANPTTTISRRESQSAMVSAGSSIR